MLVGYDKGGENLVMHVDSRGMCLGRAFEPKHMDANACCSEEYDAESSASYRRPFIGTSIIESFKEAMSQKDWGRQCAARAIISSTKPLPDIIPAN